MFSLARIVVAVLLIGAAVTNSEIYLLVTKAIVTGVAVWVAFEDSENQDEGHFGIWTLFYAIAAYIYFPFSKFSYSANDWIVLDWVFAFGFLTTIFAHHPEWVVDTFGIDDKSKSKRRFHAVVCVSILLLACVLGVLAIKPISRLKELQKNGIKTEGRITEVAERWSASGDDISFDGHSISYEFTNESGRKFNGVHDDEIYPFTGTEDKEKMKKAGSVYEMTETEKYPVDVYFDRTDPRRNAPAVLVEKSTWILLIQMFFFEGLAIAVIAVAAIRSFLKAHRKSISGEPLAFTETE